MLSRFKGPSGHRRLIDALVTQEVVEHDRALAERIAKVGTLECVEPGQDIIVQDASDNEIYFIVSGTVAVYVNGRMVASRGNGHCVGEMALIDVSAKRSATVRATSELVYVKIPEHRFHLVGDEHPQIWRAFAKILGDRLRQRSAFHHRPNARPILFLGCSTESLPLAEALRDCLAREDIETRIWKEKVFGPSDITLDTLIKHAHEVDFAAFIFGPDDLITSRGKALSGPRDNVVFELGLFMGQLARERAFVISGPMELKMPSDLHGLTHIRIGRGFETNLPGAAPTLCTELMDAISRHGCR